LNNGSIIHKKKRSGIHQNSQAIKQLDKAVENLACPLCLSRMDGV
jgi:hypothetical protein